MVSLSPLAKLQNGTKVYSVCGQRFEVSKGYTLKKLIGVGSYGVVCSAVACEFDDASLHRNRNDDLFMSSHGRVNDLNSGHMSLEGGVRNGDGVSMAFFNQNCYSSSSYGTSSFETKAEDSLGKCRSNLVAIKKIAHVFDNKHTAKCVLREMEILTSVRHVNLIKLHHFLRPPVKETFEDIYLVTDLYDTDLHHIIQSGQNLTEEHYQYFMVQAFRGLNYLHSAGIMHRDLKPSNLLVNADCQLAICDFGLARGEEARFVATSNTNTSATAATLFTSIADSASCSASGPSETAAATAATCAGALTQYVVTRWYRPPEVLGMGSSSYTSAVDVWSLGLILAELIAGRIVLPGTDYISQLVMIVQLLGTPSEEDMEFLSPEARTFLLSQPVVSTRRFSELFPNASADAVDLLSRLLQFHPSKRLTTRQVIEHPYFAKFRDAAAESVAEQPFVWRHGGSTTLAQLREEYWRLINSNAP